MQRSVSPVRALRAAQGRLARAARPAELLWMLVERVAAIDLYTLTVALGVLIGVFVRAQYVFAADFPLNDGGLFYQMTRELQQAAYRLPEYTAYNGGQIPFAYPPLGFYVAGLLDDLTPLSLLDAFRFLPLAATCLTLVAFAALARDLLRSRTAVTIAVFAFALVPRSFIWMLMGGGVTRALGLLLALLALHEIHRMYTRPAWRHAPAAAVLSALTALSHLQTASFLAFSALVFLVAYGLHRRGLWRTAIVGAGTVVLTAPWWGSVVVTHGVAPFLAANATGGSIFSDAALRAYLVESLLRLGTTSEPLFPLIGTLAFIGVIACVVARWFLLPAWWAAIILLDARAFPTFSTVPVAMLAGIGLTEVLLPLVLRPLRAGAWTPAPEGADPQHLFHGVSATNALRSWAPVLLAVFLWYATNGALMRSGETPALVALSPAERASLAWVRAETAPESRFLIVSAEPWSTDKTAEWFPVLADRVSVVTVQGYEWVPDRFFEYRAWTHDLAQGCAYADAACIVQWRKDTATDFDYVLIPKPPYGQCCDRLVTSLRHDGGFRVVYDGAGATVFRRGG